MFGRHVLLVLPALTVLVVAFAVLGSVRERPVVAARLYGGPTENTSRLAWRLQVVTALGQSVVPRAAANVHVRVHSAAGAETTAVVDTDPSGAASAMLDRPHPGARPLVEIRLGAEGPVLARGAVNLSRSDWARGAVRRGGWMGGRSTGKLRVRAAPGRGVFAVPFSDPLWVEVLRSGSPVAGAELRVRAEGADVESSVGRTDSNGRWATRLRPDEHAITLFIDATEFGETGRYEGTVPIVPGALHAVRDHDGVVIRSPIPRERAYLSLVTANGRFDGRALDLAPDRKGGAFARFEASALPTEPLWAVVSSESDMRSMALLGWPLVPVRGEVPAGDPPKTFDVRDSILLDGLGQVKQRERARNRWLLGFAAAFTLFSSLVTVLLVWKRIEASQQLLDAHLARELGAESSKGTVSRARFGRVQAVLALACIALGFVVLAVLALMRLE